ncbi:MAG: signal peptide peptidase SppA, partial [Bacteroidota bacterium]
MKQFFKFFFASCLGTIFALGGLMFIFFSVLASTAVEPTSATPVRGILTLRFDNIIPEHTDNIGQSGFLGSSGSAIGLHDIIRLIKTAKNDSKINGILLETEAPQLAPTSAKYVHDALLEFKRDSDKFVHAYGDYFSQSGYMIACAADSIILNPNGLIDLKGYGVTMPYYKSFSDKTGIEFDVYHAGKFKSAVEPFYRTESSDENRLQTQSYLSAFHDQLVNVISTDRNLLSADIDDIVVHRRSSNAESCLDFGLVDQVGFFEDYEENMEEMLGAAGSTYIELQDYYDTHPRRSGSARDRIAVIYAEGTITGGSDERGQVSMDVYEKTFEKIENNDRIKAVVLRVNSGGGSAFTSDVFMDRVKDLQNAGKYVVASFGDYAASGGYYIAAGADFIMAEPTTLTGSIGVFSVIPDLNGMFEDHLGINWDTISTGAQTFLYSTMISRSDRSDAILTSETERTYDRFKRVVAEGRNMSIVAVDEIAQGRVWTGEQGFEVGLVDSIGTLEDAISYATMMAELEDYKVLHYPIIEKTIWEEALESIEETTNAKLATRQGEITSVIGEELYQVL